MPQPVWDIGTMLYRKADTEQAGIVTGYIVRTGNSITYLVAWAEDGELEHFVFELVDEKTL